MRNYECPTCGCTEQFSCRCWEDESAKYRPRDIAGQIRLEELRDEHYGVGRTTRRG